MIEFGREKRFVMIADIIKYYIFENLDRQIINKISYCLVFSLVIYPFLNVGLNTLVTPIVILFFLFLATTAYFNRSINIQLNNWLACVEFKKFVGKISSIFEGKNSLVEDIKTSENKTMLILGFIGGLSLFLLLILIFLVILNYFRVANELILVILILLVIYLYQDINKSPLAVGSKETKFPILLDCLEMYTINNSLRLIPMEKSLSRTIVYFLSKTIGPLIHLDIPKFTFDLLLVYKNPRLIDIMRDLLKKNDNIRKIYLKYEGGQPVDNFIVEEKGEKITMLLERSPQEIFPYLFNPEYSYSEGEQKKWVAFRVIEKNSSGERTVGYVFVHLFRGVFIKRKIRRTRPYETESQPKQVFLFIFIGERNYLQYIKTKIEVICTKFPQEIMNLEYSE